MAPQQFAPPQLTQDQPVPKAGNLPSSPIDADAMKAFFEGLSPTTTQADIRAAMTPVAQKAPTQVPGYYGFRTPNPPPVNIDRSERVGAAAARSQGIGNAISATVGALAQFKATRDQRKQEADATKVSRLVEAQNALQQAQQTFQTTSANDPAHAQAQKAISDNNNIIQGMFQDPKFVKTIEKGFQISMTDPSQNKTPEHGIVQRGLDMFRQKSGQQVSPQEAQRRFQTAQPTVFGPNVQAQQNLQMKQMEDAARAQMAKDRIDWMKSQQTVSAAQIRAYGEIQKANIDADSKWNTQMLKYGQDMDVAAYDRDTKLMVEAARSKTTRGDDLMKLFDTASNSYQKAMDSFATQSRELTAKISAEQAGKNNPEIVAEYRGQQALLQKALDDAQAKWGANQKWFSAQTGIPLDVLQEGSVPKVGEGVPDAGPTGYSKFQQTPEYADWRKRLDRQYFYGLTPGTGGFANPSDQPSPAPSD